MGNEAAIANTVAHELSHARDFIRIVDEVPGAGHKPHGNSSSLNGGSEPDSVYGAGNALEDYINGGR